MNTEISPTSAKSSSVVNNVAAAMRLSFVAAMIGERARNQGAADAVSDGVDLGLSGRPLDRVDRRQRPFEQIVAKTVCRRARRRD